MSKLEKIIRLENSTAPIAWMVFVLLPSFSLLILEPTHFPLLSMHRPTHTPSILVLASDLKKDRVANFYSSWRTYEYHAKQVSHDFLLRMCPPQLYMLEVGLCAHKDVQIKSFHNAIVAPSKSFCRTSASSRIEFISYSC